MKKLLFSVSTLVVAICLSAFLCLSTLAAYLVERENNNSFESANVISVGDQISGVITDTDNPDFYKLVAPDDGRLNIRFNHTYKDASESWNIYLYRYSNGQYDEIYGYRVGLSDNESIALPFIGAVKGGVYYIKVETTWNNHALNCNYSVGTSFIKSDYYEKEINDSYTDATKISLGNTYTGVLDDRSDKDFYKIVSSENGKINLSFNHTYAESDGGWVINVYRYANGQYDWLYEKRVDLTDNESVALPFVGAVKGGVYFVKIEGIWNRFPAGYNYSLKTSFTKTTCEAEVNDSYAAATKMSFSKPFAGVMAHTGDKDFFKIVAPATGIIDIEFKHATMDSSDHWYIETYIYANGAYTRLSETAVALDSRRSVYLSSISAKKGGVYYVVVSANFYQPKVVDKNYSLEASYYVPRASKTTTKSTASSVAISWNKVGGASGYQLQMKSGKTYKSVTTTSKTKFTVKKLKAGTKYTFRVRAYTVVSGVKYYSSWTTISTATSPTTPSLKVSAGKKSATLKAAKQAADGFVIYRADSKNGTFKKIATVKGTSLSFKNKGLKSQKAYYYKVRAYVSVNGVNHYSAYSSVKAVKAK